VLGNNKYFQFYLLVAVEKELIYKPTSQYYQCYKTKVIRAFSRQSGGWRTITDIVWNQSRQNMLQFLL